MPKITKLLLVSFIIPSFFITQIANALLLSNNSGKCLRLSNNLISGDRDAQTNGDVTRLQTFLYNNGYLTVNPTGFFGVKTKEAVNKLQSSVIFGVQASDIDSNIVTSESDRQELSSSNFVLSVTGYVGKYTRAKIAFVSCFGGDNLNANNEGNGLEEPVSLLQGASTCIVPTYNSASYSNSFAAANGTCEVTLTWSSVKDPLSSKVIKWQLAGSDFWSGNITLADPSLSSKSKTFTLGQSSMVVVISSDGQDISSKVISGICDPSVGAVRNMSNGRCIAGSVSQGVINW